MSHLFNFIVLYHDSKAEKHQFLLDRFTYVHNSIYWHRYVLLYCYTLLESLLFTIYHYNRDLRKTTVFLSFLGYGSNMKRQVFDVFLPK